MSAYEDNLNLFKSPLLIEHPFAEFVAIKARPVVAWREPCVESTGRRYWRHPNSPPGSQSDYPAVIINDFGDGQAMLVAASLFGDYWAKKHWYLRSVTNKLLDLLQVRPIVKVQNPNISLELNVTQDDSKIQIHLITFQEMPRTLKSGLIGANPPIAGLVLEIAASATGDLTHITLEPNGNALEWEHKGNHVTVALPAIQGYNIVEIG